MAVNINKDGTWEAIYTGPYTGINTMMPENLIKDTDTPASNDFIFRNAELRSRPAFVPNQFASPVPANRITAVGSLQGQMWAVALNGLYQFNFGGGTWSLVTGAANAHVANWRVFANTLYLSHAQSNQLSSWNINAGFTLNIATVGANNVAGTFIDELDNHLLMANMGENGLSFPNRIRWSATSLPTVWDPAVNVNAGFNDFLDVPDAITGMMMLGRVGYILRADGITEISPTGQGTAPFQFNHLWANQFGLGATKYYGTDTYGNTGVIIGRDNIYQLTSYEIQSIGGPARDAIFTDLSNTAGGTQLSNIFGVIVPYFRSGIIPDVSIQSNNSSNETPFPYLLYMLFINLPGGNLRIWVCNLENNNSWEQYNVSGYICTGRPSLVQDNLQAPTLLIPVNNGTISSIATFNFGSFNDSLQGSSHMYKAEDVAPGRVITVNRVVMTYRDLGSVIITVAIKGSDDQGTVSTATQTTTVGGLNDGLLKTALLYPVKSDGTPFVGYRPQLTVSRGANGGPLSISMMQMLGSMSPMELT